MNLLQKLQEQGWYFTEEGLEKLIATNNLQTEDVNKIISLALNWDLRDIAGGALPSKPDSNGTIPGRIVLQLQKMRNISAPKSNEESTTVPRFLQLELSDGVNNIAALEFERIANLNLNVPPGTKLFLNAEKLKLLNGFLVLRSSDIQVIGGKVETLVEKWELARQMLKYARSNRLSGSGGPPPWIAFGKSLDTHKDVLSTDKNFKSLQIANEKDKNSKENDEFIASRSQAIAEAARTGQKKVFGGGQQNIVDHNVKKILEKGYSEDEAKQALKTTNNNLERALYSLKRKNNIRSGTTENSIKPVVITQGGRFRDRGGLGSTKEDSAASKPQTNVSLFDFLSNQFPVTISPVNAVQNEAVINNTNIDPNLKEANSVKSYNNKAINVGGNRFENNMSSSFAANRATVNTTCENRNSTLLRPNTFNRKHEERIQQSGNRARKDEERNVSNKGKTQSQNYNQLQNTPLDYGCNLAGDDNTKRNDKPLKSASYRQSNNDHQANKRSSDCNKATQKSCQSSKYNRNNQDSNSNTNNYHQKQIQKVTNFDKRLDNLANSTSKLSIQNKKDLSGDAQVTRSKGHQQSSGNTKNHKCLSKQEQKCENTNNSCSHHSSQFVDMRNNSSKSFPQNAKLATYPHFGNDFVYDHSKIIGFQSKEANEYAMNILKSQGMATQQHSPAAAPETYAAQNNNYFVTPRQVAAQFCRISGENWPWKEGDLCLAKYWDDGNYYRAKITAVSEKTCVVLFLEYGNHEEVLKSDCIPMTTDHYLPVDGYQTTTTTASISQPTQPMFQQRSHTHSVAGGVTNQRYRSERQMYVPPPKRNN